ncbi:hypothetical protein OIU77_015186 [Salix suchowensis]|uniref:Uncharacterized protein n=1 Tax=Salix suchowensis TaxID=1278906 RepID=A0ABQ8ZS81_9ROSI|nr:hypothetical protein OIU77_015186 [Salix suchowensis]
MVRQSQIRIQGVDTLSSTSRFTMSEMKLEFKAVFGLQSSLLKLQWKMPDLFIYLSLLLNFEFVKPPDRIFTTLYSDTVNKNITNLGVIIEVASSMSTSTMSLKLLIDSKHNKVVVAEAGKDFVHFLLNLLSLPLGTVIQLLTKPAMTGCVANLYGSLEELDESYLQPNQNKDSLLKTNCSNPDYRSKFPAS